MPYTFGSIIESEGASTFLLSRELDINPIVVKKFIIKYHIIDYHHNNNNNDDDDNDIAQFFWRTKKQNFSNYTNRIMFPVLKTKNIQEYEINLENCPLWLFSDNITKIKFVPSTYGGEIVIKEIKFETNYGNLVSGTRN